MIRPQRGEADLRSRIINKKKAPTPRKGNGGVRGVMPYKIILCGLRKNNQNGLHQHHKTASYQ